MSNKKWRVYGYDTFAGEDYFIGAFLSETEAQECAKKQEKILEQTQDESLRDRVWIASPENIFHLETE